MELSREQYLERLIIHSGAESVIARPIEFINPTPEPFKVQIPLWEYFERVKRYKIDRWQKHFCDYLQNACETRHIKGTLAEFHAEPQLGKTTILSQVFIAWKIAHYPLWREILAMYNQKRSEKHSRVVIGILRSAIHRDMFPNKDGHLPAVVSADAWSTNARLDNENGRMDGQTTFSGVGLISGITGSGADSYTIDDPYKNPSEAHSVAVREALTLFWEDGINARLTPNDCVFAMFHRYAYDDFGGYLLDTSRFDYVRYASIADGPYVHEHTGQKFEDPLGRSTGEYISERRGEAYYRDKIETNSWPSMFQGRPSNEDSEFFKVKRIRILEDDAELERERAACTLWVRAYDSASTKGGGDFSAAAKIGMQPNGNILVDHMALEQVDSAGYAALQTRLAEEDGPEVTVCIPKPLSDAGSHIVYHTEQLLKGRTVVARSVGADSDKVGSTPKHRRAYNLSTAVNQGQVMFASDKYLPKAKKWNDVVIRCLRQFGLSSFDDPVDALGDGYNHLYEQHTRGLVVDFNPAVHLKQGNGKLPPEWRIYAGVKITPESNSPNSSVIVARAPRNTDLADSLFILDEYKQYDDDHEALFTWLSESLAAYCENPKTSAVWLHKDSEAYLPLIQQKIKGFQVSIFHEAPLAGISELGWYLQRNALTGLVHKPEDLAALQQEAATWGYTDKGVPSGVGQVWDCLRMIAYRFRTVATPLTKFERQEKALPAKFRLETIQKQKEEMTQDEYSRALLTRDVQIAMPKIISGATKPKTRFARFKK